MYVSNIRLAGAIDVFWTNLIVDCKICPIGLIALYLACFLRDKKVFLYWQALAQQAGQSVLEETFVVYAVTETQKRPYGTFLCWKEVGALPLVSVLD